MNNITKQGYAIVIVDRQGYEGWTTVDASGVLHLDSAKLRVSDASQPDGFRRDRILPRTFSRSTRYEVRWLREPPGAEQPQEMEADR